jgi:Domain of unknown function (DUF4158)
VLNRLALALQIGFLKMTGGTLNSVEIIPTGVLEHLGRQLGCAPPRIASIRALYRRRRTLFDHQAAALHTLGRTEPSEHAERGLVAYLRREAAAVFDNVELMARSRSWLVDHDYLVLREREIRRLVGAARRHQEQALFKTIAAVAGPDREAWLPRLLAPIEDGGAPRREEHQSGAHSSQLLGRGAEPLVIIVLPIFARIAAARITARWPDLLG